MNSLKPLFLFIALLIIIPTVVSASVLTPEDFERRINNFINLSIEADIRDFEEMIDDPDEPIIYDEAGVRAQLEAKREILMQKYNAYYNYYSEKNVEGMHTEVYAVVEQLQQFDTLLNNKLHTRALQDSISASFSHAREEILDSGEATSGTNNSIVSQIDPIGGEASITQLPEPTNGSIGGGPGSGFMGNIGLAFLFVAFGAFCLILVLFVRKRRSY